MDGILHFSNLNPKMIWTTTYHHLTKTKSSEPKNYTWYFVHVCYWIYLLFLLHFNQVSITICSAEWTCLYVAEVILCIHGKHYKSDLNGIIFVSSHTFHVLIQAVTFILKIIGFSEQNFILIIFESIQIFWRMRFTWLHIGQILFLVLNY